MSSFGLHIGLAAEVDGNQKAAEELIIEENIWMSIARIQENIIGLIGESKLTSRNMSQLFGKEK